MDGCHLLMLPNGLLLQAAKQDVADGEDEDSSSSEDERALLFICMRSMMLQSLGESCAHAATVLEGSVDSLGSMP
eukprot:1160860-Pelagomonas_calceolata.AAC.3